MPKLGRAENVGLVNSQLPASDATGSTLASTLLE